MRKSTSYASIRCIIALILREMSTRYGRSPGGYLWAVLEPLLAIMVLAFGFSLFIRTPLLGSSFLLFYATGYLPFQLYTSVADSIMRCIDFNRALLFYPMISWVDNVLARFLLNALTAILVSYILLTGIRVFTETRSIIDFSPIAWAYGLAMFLALGVGTINCVIMGLFPVWTTIWGIAMRPLMIASGVFFLYDDMPRTVQNLLWWNPLIHVTGFMRRGFYPNYDANYASITYVAACAIATLAFGIILMRRYHRQLMER